MAIICSRLVAGFAKQILFGIKVCSTAEVPPVEISTKVGRSPLLTICVRSDAEYLTLNMYSVKD